MTVDVAVRGMTCQGCESVVETAVEMLDGVEEVTADRYEGVVQVEGDVAPDDVATKVELAGYKAIAEVEAADEPTDEPVATEPAVDGADETEE